MQNLFSIVSLFIGFIAVSGISPAKTLARDCETYGQMAESRAWMGCITSVHIDSENRFKRTVYLLYNGRPVTAQIDCRANRVFFPENRQTGFIQSGTILRRACTEYD